MRPNDKVHRLNLELGPRSHRALRRLQADLEASSQADTIRFALQTLEMLLEEIHAGGTVSVRRTDGEELKVLLVPNLHTPPRKR